MKEVVTDVTQHYGRAHRGKAPAVGLASRSLDDDDFDTREGDLIVSVCRGDCMSAATCSRQNGGECRA